MLTSFEMKLRAAEQRARRENGLEPGPAASATATGEVVPSKQKTTDDGLVPKTVADYEAEQAPPGWTLAEAWSLQWPQVRPLAVFAAVAGYTAVWWMTATGVAVAVMHAAVGYAAVALAAGKLAKRWDTDKRRIALGGVVAVTWLVVAMVLGPSYGIVVVGWLLALTLAARYWQRRRPGYPDGPPLEIEPSPEPEPVLEVEPAAAPSGLEGDWATYATDLLPGSRLEYRETTKYTHDHKLYLKRGQTTKKVAGQLEEIASMLDVMPEKLLLEPESGENASPTRMDLKYIHTSPVSGVTPYTGPRFKNGVVTLGPHIDGIGEAGVRLYQGGSLWSTFVSGDTGSGKSRVLETIAVGAVSDPLTYPTILLYTDPQGGISSPALMEGAARSSGLVDIWPLLTSVAAVAELRQKEASQSGEIGFRCRPCTCPDPITAMVTCRHRDGCGYKPGILWVIEESHSVLEDKHVRAIIERLARETRKIGIGLTLASQNGTLEAAFAGSTVLRSSLLAGNAVSLRTEDRMSSQVLGFEYDTRTLPQQGYLVAKQTVPGNRPVPARCVPPIDPEDTTRSTAAEWLTRYPRLALPPVEQELVGSDWLASAVAVNQSDDVAPSREYIEIRPGNAKVRDYVYAQLDKRLGTSLRHAGPTPAMTARSNSEFGELDVPTYADLVAEVEDALAGVSVTDPAVRPSPVRTRIAQPPPEPGTREHSAQRVYEHLAAGYTSTAELADATGWTPVYVRSLLEDLNQVGRARKTGRGQWEAVR